VRLESDDEDVKVSELYFDILYRTSDIYVGIPADFTSTGDNEGVSTDIIDSLNIKWSDDADEILAYFN